MRFAYCILSHRDPNQVERLVNRLKLLSPDASIHVHHDPRAGESLSGESAKALIESQPAHWGRWSLVEAMLRVLRAAYDDGAEAAVLISGQDYPIRPLSTWEASFEAEGIAAVIDMAAVTPPGPSGSARPRDDRYLRTWLTWHDMPRLPAWVRPGRLSPFWHKVRARVLGWTEPTLSYRVLPSGRGVFGVRRWSTPFDEGSVVCYWGSQWLALRRDALEYVLAAPAHSPAIHRLYRTALIPDESYFQTLVATAGLPIRTAPITYLEWAGEHGEEHPRTIDTAVLDRAIDSGLPFTRKVDAGRPDLLDRADITSAP